MERDDLFESYDHAWAISPATKLELYMVARLLQNYTLLRVNELADVSLRHGEKREEIVKRIARMEEEIDRTLIALIARGEEDDE